MKTHQRLIFLLLAILLAICGQTALLSSKGLIGLPFYVISIILFTIISKENHTSEIEIDPGVKKIFTRIPFLAILGMLLTAFATWQSTLRNTTFQHGLAVAGLWLTGVVVFAIGVLTATSWRPLQPSKFWEKVKAHKLEIIFVAAITLLGFLIRVVGIESHPYAVSNDESKLAYEATRIARGEYIDLFEVAGDAYPILSFIPESLVVLLLGKSILAIRLLSAVEGSLTLLFLYLIAKEGFGKRIAFLAMGILMALPVHVHYSRVGINNILMGLHAVLIFWLLLRSFKTGKPAMYLWAGLMTGSALYAYSGSRLVMALAVFLIGLVGIIRRDFIKTNWQNLLIYSGAALVMVLPLVAFFIKEPNLYNARLNTVLIFNNNWLPLEVIKTGKSILEILFDQFVKSVGVFISRGEYTGFYGSPDPFFNAVTSLFLVLGIGLSISKIRKPLYFFLLVWFWSVVNIGGMLTVPAPSSQRLIIALPAAAIFIAIALDGTFQSLQQSRIINFRFGVAVKIILIAIISINGLNAYFVEFRESGYFARPAEELQIESIKIEKALGPNYRYVLIGDPYIFLLFRNYLFLLDGYDQIEIPAGINVLDFVANNLTAKNPIEGASDQLEPTFFVSITDRAAELNQIASAYPGGNKVVIYRQTEPKQILLHGYIYPYAEVELPQPGVMPDLLGLKLDWSQGLLTLFKR